MSRKDITVDDIRLLDKKPSQHQSKVVHAVHADEAVRIVDPKLGAIPLKAWRTSAWHLGADLRWIIPQRLQGGACWLFCTKISHQLHTELLHFILSLPAKQILGNLSRAQSSGAWLKTFGRISHNWLSSSSICWWKASGQSRRNTSVIVFLYCACGHCIYLEANATTGSVAESQNHLPLSPCCCCGRRCSCNYSVSREIATHVDFGAFFVLVSLVVGGYTLKDQLFPKHAFFWSPSQFGSRLQGITPHWRIQGIPRWLSIAE